MSKLMQLVVMDLPPLIDNAPQLRYIHMFPSEGHKRLIKELDTLTLELTHLCISHALKTVLPPNIENLVSKLLEKRRALYRDDVLNADLNDAERMDQIQGNGEWIKLQVIHFLFS